MNLKYTLCILALISTDICAQGDVDYYRKSIPENFGRKPVKVEELLIKIQGAVKVKNRLYFGLNGFVQKNNTTISNDFEGLIGTEATKKGAYGVSIGWITRESWSLEAEYTRSPIYHHCLPCESPVCISICKRQE